MIVVKLIVFGIPLVGCLVVFGFAVWAIIYDLIHDGNDYYQ